MKMSNYSKSKKSRTDNKKTKKQIAKQEITNNQEIVKQEITNNQDTETNAKDNIKTWNEEWNAVFHHFINRNSTKLLRTYYAGLVRAWQKKPTSEREVELAIANKVIARVS
jgi:hypothetical protein